MIFWSSQRVNEVPAHDRWLSTREQDTWAGFRFPKRKSDWRLGRWTAKQVLNACLKAPVALDRIEILAAEDGAPEAYLDGVRMSATISISHSQGRALCVADPAGGLLGCDLEKIEARSPAFLQDYFTEQELQAVQNTPPPEQAMTANLIWCAKESALKALREGLRLDTRSVSAHWQPGPVGDSWWRLQVDYPSGGKRFTGHWRAWDGYVWGIVGEKENRLARVRGNG